MVGEDVNANCIGERAMIKNILAAVGFGFIGYQLMRWYADHEVEKYAQAQGQQRQREGQPDSSANSSAA